MVLSLDTCEALAGLAGLVPRGREREPLQRVEEFLGAIERRQSRAAAVLWR
jgi:hypothetical protein